MASYSLGTKKPIKRGDKKVARSRGKVKKEEKEEDSEEEEDEDVLIKSEQVEQVLDEIRMLVERIRVQLQQQVS